MQIVGFSHKAAHMFEVATQISKIFLIMFQAVCLSKAILLSEAKVNLKRLLVLKYHKVKCYLTVGWSS